MSGENRESGQGTGPAAGEAEGRHAPFAWQSAEPVTLEALTEVQALSGRPAALSADAAPTRPVSLPGLTADMPAVQQAGVDLVKRLLWIMVGTIVGLVLYLFVMDLRNARELAQTYQQVFDRIVQANHLPEPQIIEALAAQAREAVAGKDPKYSSTTWRDFLQTVERAEAVTVAQGRELRGCFEEAQLPAGAKGDQAKCLEILEELRRRSLAVSVNLEQIKLLREVSRDVNGDRQAFHAFWVQIVQLILLNLLLPLVTALLGYIFGTQQVTTASGRR